MKHLTRLVDDLLDVSEDHPRQSRASQGARRHRGRDRQGGRDGERSARARSSSRSPSTFPAASSARNGDPVRLAQVVSNLLTNAARYTDPGGAIRPPRIEGGQYGRHARQGQRVSGSRPSSCPEYSICSFRESAARTGPRWSGHRAHAGQEPGRPSRRQRGGQLRGPWQGSAFTVTLPASAPPRSKTSPPTTASELPAKCGSGRKYGRRVLIVDDNIDAADLLADVIRDGGHEVQVAYGPVAALEVVESFHPEVAVLDVGLPVMDGYELAQGFTPARKLAHPSHRADRVRAGAGPGAKQGRRIRTPPREAGRSRAAADRARECKRARLQLDASSEARRAVPNANDAAGSPAQAAVNLHGGRGAVDQRPRGQQQAHNYDRDRESEADLASPVAEIRRRLPQALPEQPPFHRCATVT